MLALIELAMVEVVVLIEGGPVIGDDRFFDSEGGWTADDISDLHFGVAVDLLAMVGGQGMVLVQVQVGQDDFVFGLVQLGNADGDHDFLLGECLVAGGQVDDEVADGIGLGIEEQVIDRTDACTAFVLDGPAKDVWLAVLDLVVTAF